MGTGQEGKQSGVARNWGCGVEGGQPQTTLRLFIMPASQDLGDGTLIPAVLVVIVTQTCHMPQLSNFLPSLSSAP